LVIAQANPSQPTTRLTLGAAIEKAEANYPRIRAAVEQHTAAQAGIGTARAAYLPRTELLWQTNRATANNIYGLLLPQSIISSLTGPVLPADNGRSAWSSAGGALITWQPFDFGYRHANVEFARWLEKSFKTTRLRPLGHASSLCRSPIRCCGST
jgi:outer membrane protein TolC